MASTKEKAEATTPAYDPYERVEIYIERPASAKDDPNLFVSVNGINYLLPKGEETMVPESVAYELERSRAAENAQVSNSAELQKKAEAPI